MDTTAHRLFRDIRPHLLSDLVVVAQTSKIPPGEQGQDLFFSALTNKNIVANIDLSNRRLATNETKFPE